MAYDWFAEGTPAVEEVQQEQSFDFAPTQRGFAGDVASRVARSGVDTVGLLGSALETFGVPTPLSELAEASKKKFDFLKPDIDEYLGREGFVERGIKAGPAAIVPSLAGAGGGALLGAKAGALFGPAGAATGGTIGGILGILGLFGAGTYGEAKKEYLEANPNDPDGAHDFAMKAGLIEGGGETIATGIGVLSFGLGKAATMPLKRTLKELIKTSPKDIGKAYVTAAAGEVGTEVPQNVLGAMNRIAAGLPSDDPMSAGMEAIIPAMTMSFLFSSGAASYNAVQQNRLINTLHSDIEGERLAAAKLISKNLEAQDPEFARAWDTTFQDAESKGEPVSITEDFVALGNQLGAVKDTIGDIEQRAGEMQKEIDQTGDVSGAVKRLLVLGPQAEAKRVEGKALLHAQAANDPTNKKMDKILGAEEKALKDAETAEEIRLIQQESEQKVRQEILGPQAAVQRFIGEARLSVLAANDPKNTEIIQKLEEVEKDTNNVIPPAQKEQITKVLLAQAEENTQNAKPMEPERLVEITDRMLSGTATPTEIAELSFEDQRRAELLKEAEAKAPADKKPTEAKVKAEKEFEEAEEAIKTAEVAKEAELTKEMARGPEAQEARNVTQELAGAPALEEKPEDLAVNRVGGKLKFKETTAGFFEATDGDIPILLAKDVGGKTYNVFVDGKEVAVGLPLEDAAKRANQEVAGTGGTGAKLEKDGKKIVKATVGNMTAEPIDPGKPKSLWKVTDNETGRVIKSTGLRTSADATRFMERQQDLAVTEKQTQAKPGEGKKKEPTVAKPKKRKPQVISEEVVDGVKVTKLEDSDVTTEEVVKEKPKVAKEQKPKARTITRKKADIIKEAEKRIADKLFSIQDSGTLFTDEGEVFDAKQLLDVAAKDKGFSGKLARALRNTMPEHKLRNVEVMIDSSIENGYYSPQEHTVYIKSDQANTMVHEIVHALTHWEMAVNPKFAKRVEGLRVKLEDKLIADGVVTGEEILEAQRLKKEKLRDFIQAVDREDNKKAALLYAVSSNDEFLGQAVGSEVTQEALKEIPVENPKGRIKTLWDSLVDNIRKILKLPQGQWNALAETLETIGEISTYDILVLGDGTAVDLNKVLTSDFLKLESIVQEGEPKEKTEKEKLQVVAEANDASGTPAHQFWVGLKAFTKDVKVQSLKTFEVLSDTLRRISPAMMHKLRQFEFKSMRNQKRHIEAVTPFIQKLKKLPKEVHADLWYSLYNPAKRNDKALEIIKKHNLTKEYIKVKEVLDELQERADTTGILISKVKNYFPRYVKDYEGLMQFFNDQAGKDSGVARELAEAKEQAKQKGKGLSPQERQDLVARFMVNGLYSKIPNPGSVKQRSLPHVPSDAMQYYSNLTDSLLNHIIEMNDKVGAFETVGKFGRKKAIDALKKAEEKLLKKPDDKGLKKEYDLLASRIETIEDSLSRSVAAMLESEGDMGKGQKDLAARLFKARFTQRGTRGAVHTMKNLGLAMTLGNPLSAITQIGDQAFNIYRNKQNALGGMVGALKDKEFTKEFNFDNQLREFSQSGQSQMLDKLLTTVGLKAFDLYGKESFMKSSLKRWEGSTIEEFKKSFGKDGEVFEDVKKVHDVLKKGGRNADGSMDEDALYVLYSDLADFQPINLSETPEYYLGSGNLRILYMLKTFAIKATNSIVRETTSEYKKGNYAKAAGNFIALTGLLGLMGATTDEIKDIILGKEKAMKDHFVDNLIGLTLMNRFDLEKGIQKGALLSSIATGIVPPVRYLDDVISDTANLLDPEDDSATFKSLRNVPVFGRLSYEWFTDTAKEGNLRNLRRSILDDIRETVSGDKKMSEVRKDINKFNRKARGFEGAEQITFDSIKRIQRAERNK